MKRHVFNPGLYKDTLMQLRPLGLTYAFLCIGLTVLFLSLGWFQLGNSLSGTYTEIYAVAPVLFVFMYAAPITLVYAAFSFLNHRAASDFYHALPNTRLCLGLSLFAAVMTYVLGTILLTLLAAFGLMAMLHIPCIWEQLPHLLTSLFAGSLLLAGAALIGVSATGTRFSSFVVTGLIVFLPRCLLLLCGFAAEERIGSFASILDVGLLSPLLNIPIGMLLSVLSGSESMSHMLCSLSCQLYTLLFGILYTAAGLFFFHRRASELAEKSASSRKLQHLYRSLLTLPVPLLMGALMSCDELDFDAFLLLLALALIVYAVYEVITTRSFKKLLSSLPLFPLVMIVGIMLPFLAGGTAFLVGANVPDAEDIRSVRFNASSPNTWDTYHISAYNERLQSEVEITDAGVITLVQENLQETAEYYLHGSNEYAFWNNRSGVSVALKLKNGRTLYRDIRFADSDLVSIEQHLWQHEEYHQASRAIPAQENILGIFFNNYVLTAEQARALMDTFRAEAATLSDSQWMSVCQSFFAVEATKEVPIAESAPVEYDPNAIVYNHTDNGGYTALSGSLRVLVKNGPLSYTNHYYMDTNVPETASMLMQMLNREFEGNLEHFLSDTYQQEILAFGDRYIGTFSMYNIPYKGLRYDSRNCGFSVVSEIAWKEQLLHDPNATMETYNMVPYEVFVQVIDILREGNFQAPRIDQALVSISTDYSHNFFISLTDEQAAELLQLVLPYPAMHGMIESVIYYDWLQQNAAN